jgi:succinoglycan biosynthesis protein ExoM
MAVERPHISVCICTYKRPELLKRALDGLGVQETGGLFTFSVVVVDNDAAESGCAAATSAADASGLRLTYCVEPRQNIALARNKAVANASGDFVAFLDDDECPIKEWLLTLYVALKEYHVDGVLGPVKPEFDDRAPRWVMDGGLYDRPTHPTGQVLEWSQCRTGNVLLNREIVSDDAQVFRPEFLSGEDQDFFRRKIGQGHRFIWCHEAPVYEFVPPQRWNRGFLVRRAIFRGVFSQRNRNSSLLPIAKSLVAASAYVVILPVALLLGQAKFMACVFSLSYHIGRLLAFVGINPIRQQYVVD